MKNISVRLCYVRLLMRKYLNVLLLLVVPFMCLQLSGSVALAQTFEGDACQGLSSISTEQGCGTGDKVVSNIVNTVVNILSVIVGAIAVIFIILAGYRYVSSGGDAQKVSSAKSALIYSLVGIAVAALAQLLAHTVLSTAASAAK